MTTAIQPAETTIQPAGVNFNLAQGWIDFAQVSKSSRDAYQKGIKRLAEYFAANKISQPTREDLIKYRDYLGSKYAVKTANLYITVARLFFEYLQLKGVIAVNPAQHLKVIKDSVLHKRGSLTIQQVRTIAKSIDTSTLKGKRDAAIFALMTSIGLRACEIQRANISDIYTVNGRLVIRVYGKGHNSADTPLAIPPLVAPKIYDYLAMRGKDNPDAPMFISVSRQNRGERLTVNSISRLIKTILKANGIDNPKITCHSCRHTFATVALQAGADLMQVSQILRHKSINTTTIYIDEINYLNNQAGDIAARALGF